MLSWAEWGGQRVHPLPSFTSCRFDNSPNLSTLRSAFLSAVGPHSALPFQMELQLQRQQAQAQRQTLDRLARRPPTTSAPAQVDLLSPRLCSCLFFLYIHCCRVCCPRRFLLSYFSRNLCLQAQPSAATPATSSSSSNVKPAETSTPIPSNFLLDELNEEDGTEEGMREGAEERAIFIEELLLGALSIQSEDPLQSWGFIQIIKWWCPTNRSSCLSCLLNGTVMIKVKTMSTPPNNKKSLQLNWACLYTRELLDRIISLYMLLLSFRSKNKLDFVSRW